MNSIFDEYNSLSEHADNRWKDILVLSQGPTDEWDETIITT